MKAREPSDLAAPKSGVGLRIAVVGTRGVPGRYGGFETLAEQLACHLDADQVRLTLYGERAAYSKDEREGGFCGHDRAFMPFAASGMQSMIHDALQLGHAAFVERQRNILVLGTSCAWLMPIVRLLRPHTRLVCNIDGLEWRRDKFGSFARWVLKGLEKLAVWSSDVIIADNDALVPIVREIHQVEPAMIAYGADHVKVLGAGEPASGGHVLAIARIEPENNAAMILEAVRQAQQSMVFIGNWTATAYGRSLAETYGGQPGITLRPAVYDQDVLAGIRAGATAYLHGHSVGGTNPSLVEAIFHSPRILAFDCPFNRATLDNEGAYFRTAEELAQLLRDTGSGFIPEASRERLRQRYKWSTITAQYVALFGA